MAKKNIHRMKDVPQESDIKKLLRLYRKQALNPRDKKLAKLAEDESVRLNFVDLLIDEYGKVLDGTSNLSKVERQQVQLLINAVIDYKNTSNLVKGESKNGN